MQTYGKKKRSILPSFSTLRESVSSSRSKQQKARNKEPSKIPKPRLDPVDLPKPAILRHDSIEQLAELLLEDTVTESSIDVEPDPHNLHAPPVCERSLPQLPRLLFNGDDAWAFKKVPVVSAAGTSNEVYFDSDDEYSMLAAPAANLQTQSHHHTREISVPAIPRRSSKRRSVLPKTSLSKPNIDCSAVTLANTETSPTRVPEGPMSLKNTLAAPTTTTGIDISAKITAMFAANEALKGDRVTKCRSMPLQTSASMPLMSSSGEFYEGPLVMAKKRRINNNRVLVKVKTAINERLQNRSTKKLHDSQRDDRLLDESLNELPECDEDVSSNPLSMWEIRMNEGTNLKKPKITQLTGHGVVTRKPIADEGRSLKSRKSAEDPFSESWSGITCTPSTIYDQSSNDMALDPELMPNFATGRNPFASSLVETSNTRFPAGFRSREIGRSRSPDFSPERNLPKLQKMKALAFDTDSDAFFSSSPLAQSTPRILLEPTLEKDSDRTLESVPAGCRSGHDSDLDRGSRSSYSDSDLRNGVSSRSRAKKHPSPSKTELEDFERAMRPKNDSRKSHLRFPTAREASVYKPDRFTAHEILGMKDSNANIKEQKVYYQGKPAVQCQEARGTTSSIPGMLRREREKSLAKHGIPLCHSMMDIDELQWDESEYDIGMKRL